MNTYEGREMEMLDFYRGGELPSGPIEPDQGIEAPQVTNIPAGARAKEETPDPAARAREEWIESWMNDIKTFIRNIDLQNL